MLSGRFQPWLLCLSAPFALLLGCQIHVAIGPPGTIENQALASAGSRTPKHDGKVKAAAAIAEVRPVTGWRAAKSRKSKYESDGSNSASEDVPPLPESESGDESADSPKELSLDDARPIKQDESNSESTEDVDSANGFPINLPTALRLAGAENWDIQIATERLRKAYTRLDQAKAMWLPSLVGGVGYTKHDGQIQDTRGDVLDISRNALFVGGGPIIGNSPLAGPSGGPARLFVDLSLADAIFEPLVARQEVHAEHFRQTADYSKTLLAVTIAYFELVRTQGHVANTEQDLAETREILKLTRAFVDSGKGSGADVALVRTAESQREQLVIAAKAAEKVASAELARVLQIDPATTLFSLDGMAIPVELIEHETGLDQLVATGLSQRPEIAEYQNRIHAEWQRVRSERLRPFIPNLYAGTSAGVFGGGRNGSLNQLDGRADFDIAAVWKISNLGYGTKAAIESTESDYRKSVLKSHRLRDQIATEITQSFHIVSAHKQRLNLAEKNVQIAMQSLDLNKNRIRGLERLPLEALQSVDAVAKAKKTYLDAITDFNQAQARLLQSTGGAFESQ